MALQRFHRGFPSFPSFHLCGPVSSKSKSTEVSDRLSLLPVARGKNFFFFSEGKTNSGLEIEVVAFKCVCFPPYQPGITKAETPGSFQCPLKTRQHCICYPGLVHILFIFTSILETYKGLLLF